MRGTSVIAIGEVADMVREIMVWNVVLGNCDSPGGLAPPLLGGTPRPTTESRCGGRGATALPFCRDKRGPPAVGRAAIGGIFEPRRGDF